MNRVSLMGLELDALSEREVIETVVLSEQLGGWVCPVNLDVLRQVVQAPPIQGMVEEADLIVADGMPLIWFSQLQGTPLPERVAGSSLILSLPVQAAKRDRSIFLLGGDPGVAERAAARLVALNPALTVAGTFCPEWGYEDDPARLAEIEQAVLSAKPDIVFVALGFPKQERLIRRLRPVLPTAWFISCGISFSFVTGDVRRAPVLLQRLGLEWMHRLLQEPRRLFRRYLVWGPPFVTRMLVGALLERWRAR